MATSAKDTFASDTWGPASFACGTFRGVGAVIQPPDTPGVEWTLPVNRMHSTLPENRMQYVLPENRLHYTVPEE